MVNNQAYSLFAIMEEEVRKFYTLDRSQGTRDTVVQTIWVDLCLIAAEAEENVAALVLRKIGELHITIRGFAFAMLCLKMYKQAQKKNLQKMRTIRSELCQRSWFS